MGIRQQAAKKEVDAMKETRAREMPSEKENKMNDLEQKYKVSKNKGTKSEMIKSQKSREGVEKKEKKKKGTQSEAAKSLVRSTSRIKPKQQTTKDLNEVALEGDYNDPMFVHKAS